MDGREHSDLDAPAPRARTDDGEPPFDTLRRSPQATLLRALRDYREAEQRLVTRTRSALGIAENDLTALRYLIWEEKRGRAIGPKALGRYLALSSASITSMIDRLARRGLVERRPDPDDRRAVVVTLTLDEDTRHRLLHLNDGLLEAAGALDGESAARFTRFLRDLRRTADAIEA
jgi:DNA-binding MarR family transcriptional regulator